MVLAALALIWARSPAQYDLRLKLAPNRVISYRQTGTSEQLLTLPNLETPQKMSSSVSGQFSLSLESLAPDGKSAAGNVQLKTEQSKFQSSFLTMGSDKIAPQNLKATFFPDWRIIQQASDSSAAAGSIGINPSKIMAPLTLVPIFSPVPDHPVSLHDTWQASGKMFQGAGIETAGATAAFTLASITADQSRQTAVITGHGTLPFKLTADQVQEQVQSAHMTVPALNMSAVGRVAWTITEKIDVSTGQVLSVEFDTTTSATLHLTTLDTDAHLNGTGKTVEELVPAAQS